MLERGASRTAVSPDDGLAGVLAARARAASDGRLIGDVAVGLLVALALVIWHPRAWVVPFSMAVCLAAFGGWGIADREIEEREASGGPGLLRVLRVLRGFSAVAGVLSAFVACFSLLGIGLGKWKS